MADDMDKLLYALADEADRDVDYDAMYRAVMQKQKQEKKPPLSYRVRVWSAVAACAILFISVSLYAARGGRFKGNAAINETGMTAAAAAEAPDATAETQEAAVYDMAVADAPMMAEAPAEAMAAPTAKEAPAAMNAAGGILQARADAGLFNDPYTRLVNRANENTLTPEAPENLVRIAGEELPENLTLKREDEMGEATATEALFSMLRDAKQDGVDGFYLLSAYRAYEEQRAIWERKLSEDPNYGANGAPVASMPPGSSEHQTGLAFDLTAADHKAMRASFGETPQGVWLRDNCARFGFILRYPKDKEDVTGVVYEPWHFRYVGVDMALYLTENGLTLEEAIS
ncbi:MAG: M15 family metallopeptidase [Eubacteriales bacterium]|nr:M15 family metallopeptidase [Eubacteriales bacterium]